MREKIDNEQGFVLVLSLLMLAVLMIIGISATNTSVIELLISGNDKMASQTFYRADAVTREAIGHLLVDELADCPSWMLSDDNTLLPTDMSISDERAALHDNAVWNKDTAPADSVLDNSLMSQTFPNTQMMIVDRGTPHGESLDLGASRVHGFEIYGRSQRNNSLAIIKIGFRNNYH